MTQTTTRQTSADDLADRLHRLASQVDNVPPPFRVQVGLSLQLLEQTIATVLTADEFRARRHPPTFDHDGPDAA